MATQISPMASSISVLSKFRATGTHRIYFFYRITKSPSPEWLTVSDQSGLRYAVWSTGSLLLTSLGPYWLKKKGDLGRGWKWSMSCLGERMADAGVEPCVQVEHTVAKGQWRGSAHSSMGALLPKNGRNLLVSRVSEGPPHSKTRGEPAWGVHLAGTAENSGPNPKPIKLMERFQQTAGTRGTVPLLTQHISISPQGSCRHWCRAWPSRWWTGKPVAGPARSMCPGHHPPGARTLGAWGPSSGCHCGTVNSTCNISFSPSPSSPRGLGLLGWGQFSTGWP